MDILETRAPTMAPCCTSSRDSEKGAERVEARTAEGWWEATKVGANTYLHALRIPTPEKEAAIAAALSDRAAERVEEASKQDRRAVLREAARKGELTDAEVREALGLIL